MSSAWRSMSALARASLQLRVAPETPPWSARVAARLGARDAASPFDLAPGANQRTHPWIKGKFSGTALLYGSRLQCKLGESARVELPSGIEA